MSQDDTSRRHRDHWARADEQRAGRRGAGAPADNETAQLSLGELTEAAGVSVRTVRYYIAEGLLPPPQGAGPGSAYTSSHLDRLRLIGRLKEAYLPLKEIRRRLAGLDDGDVRALLGGGDVALAKHDMIPEMALDASLAGAREYLAMLESREPYRTEPLPLGFQAPAAPAPAAGMELPPEPGGPQPARRRGPRPAGVFPSRQPQQPAPSETSPGLWHRIPLGDEAELVISDRVYGRHRDRVDWLVRWARKVFG